MFIIFTLFIGGLGYVGWCLSKPFTHRAPMFVLITGLLALAVGLLFKSIFLL